MTITPSQKDTDEQSSITSRHEDFLAAFNGADVDRLMSLFSPDAFYSDYAIAALDMNYTETRSYIEKMFSEADSITLSPVSITGTKHFTAAEWILKMRSKAPASEDTAGDDRSQEEAKPTEMEMRGVSLTWFDEEGKLITRNNDYGVIWGQS
ncbi:hypothetical protein BJY04DRAFT_223624 [Aspergillus karnatakaensis]|uniref:uncharacterized protein n=1 Tax=Aspergillus karnatakaensis TaxID=1810916 RepID=UPI003CCDF68F